MATEHGEVIRVYEETSLVRAGRTEACKGCAWRKSCHSAAGEDMEVEAVNTIGARAGDTIVLSIKTASLLKATFLLYVFPLIPLLAGALAGNWLAGRYGLDPSIASAAGGFLLFFLSFFFVRIRGNRLAETAAYKPRIIRILRKPEA